jgi:hypothetical protein
MQMKITKLLIPLLFCIYLGNAQSPIGGWQATTTDPSGNELNVSSIVTETHQVITWYSTGGDFIKTIGGSWTLYGDRWQLNVEFDSETPDNVGRTKEFTIIPNAEGYHLSPLGLTFKQIDNGSPGKLMGAWQMTSRKRGEEMVSRSINQARRTLKLLSGKRFQWIAFNVETKEFSGTGGGTYTTKDGTYTENIEFFSRDHSRVGASLEFTYELIDGHWHHSGLSSKGSPIYEIWSK